MQLQGVPYVPKYEDVQCVFHSHLFDMSKQNSVTNTKQLNSMLDCLFQNGQMVRRGKYFDTTYGCACKYRLYLVS